MIAEIIINSNVRALNKIFDYIIPKNYEDKIKIGTRVFVPFGKGKKLEDGFIIGIKEKSEFANKEISIISNQQYLNEDKVILAKLMSQKYFCNISDCIKLMLAPGTSSKEEDKRIGNKKGNFIYLNKEKNQIDVDIDIRKIKSEKQIRILKFLYENEGIYISDLENILEVSKSIIKTLEKNGYIQIKEEVIRRNPFKNKKIASDNKKQLNNEQKKCYDAIVKDIENNVFSDNLIFGITGSRKNRNIYATY